MKKAMLPKTLAMMIIIIITAGILILAMAEFSNLFGEQVNKQTCAASVAARGANPGLIGEGAKKAIPLKCATEHKCISMVGGKCPVCTGEQCTIIIVKTEEDIKKELANSMQGCFSMLGEGKIDFFGSTMTGNSRCVFCSIITFDDKVQQSFPTITYLGKYLSDTPFKDKLTYWQYLLNDPNAYFPNTIKDEYPTTKQYAVTFGFIKKGVLGTVASAVSGCLVAGIPGAYIGFVLGSPIPIIGNAVGTGLGFVGGALTCYIGGKTFLDADNSIESLFGVKATQYRGVYLIPFDYQHISQFGCQQIESIT